jgi:hypothetical protein
MRRLETKITPFQRIEVWGDDDEVEFRVTGANHAWWHRHRYLTGLAWDNMAAGVLSHPGRPRSLLMLGLGGGTTLRTLRHLCPDMEITAVEIDAGIISLARTYMELDKTGTEVITADAYAWLEHNRPGIYTPALRRAMERSIAPGGIFGVNLVVGKGHRTMQSAFRRFLCERFPAVRCITTPASLNETLTGGRDLRPWREVRACAPQFPRPADIACWQMLRARTLPAASCS